MTPKRLICLMSSTSHSQQRHPHQQEGQDYRQDDDYAITHGFRRSAKDGSVYMQKTQQEDPTRKLVKGSRATQKAKQLLQQKGATISFNECSPMPYNTGTLNDIYPNSRRVEQLQGMSVKQQRQHTGQTKGHSMSAITNQRSSILYNDSAANSGTFINSHVDQHQLLNVGE
ncbi:hypothetical protein BGZ46_001473 [Entomortierella lignicola]|nr:hypothetical protein BGZ46_001473 [Entomortierella lignicola]